MKQKVAVLHTSFVFLNVESSVTDLLEEVLPEAEVMHFVDSDVLATVMREQGISDHSTSRMVHLAQAAEDAGADVIFSACSSLGPAMEVARQKVGTPIVRIDDGMARKAVESATRIGVLATVPTTLGPTVDLIEQKAAEEGKKIELQRELSEGAFEVLMSGDKEHHDEMVVESARKLASSVEILVLAQASMTRLAPRLKEETSLEVLTSPRLGVEYVRQVLQTHQEAVSL
jgi:Asp/Glu/hydantoin racemase